MGSPDPRQIDGIGGADPLTSKVAVVSPSSRPGIDVDYLFLQVWVDRADVSDAQNCGNILAGVAPFAIEQRPRARLRSGDEGPHLHGQHVADGRRHRADARRAAGVPGQPRESMACPAPPRPFHSASPTPQDRRVERSSPQADP